MSYASTTDFIELLRQTARGVRALRMPGLDFVVAAMVRAGLFQVWVGQTAPAVNQAVTVWFQPYVSGSWAAEGNVFLYDVSTMQYEPATPALWSALFTTPVLATMFQAVTGAAGVVNVATTLLVIERAAPAATALTLPSVLARSRPLQIADWSTAVAGHTITLTPAGTETIMRLGTYALLSSPDQLAGVTLYPSPDLNGWVIAP